MTGAAVGRTQIEIDGAGSAIVFVHGLGGDSNTFQPMLGRSRGFRCIRPRPVRLRPLPAPFRRPLDRTLRGNDLKQPA